MDFFAMKRKELQALCKKHGIRANMKNTEMAERLNLLLKEDEEPVTIVEPEVVVVIDSSVESKKRKKVRFSPENENQTFYFLATDKDSDSDSDCVYDPKKKRGGRRKSIRNKVSEEKEVEKEWGLARNDTRKRTRNQIVEDEGQLPKPTLRRSRRNTTLFSSVADDEKELVICEVDETVKIARERGTRKSFDDAKPGRRSSRNACKNEAGTAVEMNTSLKEVQDPSLFEESSLVEYESLDGSSMLQMGKELEKDVTWKRSRKKEFGGGFKVEPCLENEVLPPKGRSRRSNSKPALLTGLSMPAEGATSVEVSVENEVHLPKPRLRRSRRNTTLVTTVASAENELEISEVGETVKIASERGTRKSSDNAKSGRRSSRNACKKVLAQTCDDIAARALEMDGTMKEILESSQIEDSSLVVDESLDGSSVLGKELEKGVTRKSPRKKESGGSSNVDPCLGNEVVPFKGRSRRSNSKNVVLTELSMPAEISSPVGEPKMDVGLEVLEPRGNENETDYCSNKEALGKSQENRKGSSKKVESALKDNPVTEDAILSNSNLGPMDNPCLSLEGKHIDQGNTVEQNSVVSPDKLSVVVHSEVARVCEVQPECEGQTSDSLNLNERSEMEKSLIGKSISRRGGVLDEQLENGVIASAAEDQKSAGKIDMVDLDFKTPAEAAAETVGEMHLGSTVPTDTTLTPLNSSPVKQVDNEFQDECVLVTENVLYQESTSNYDNNVLLDSHNTDGQVAQVKFPEVSNVTDNIEEKHEGVCAYDQRMKEVVLEDTETVQELDIAQTSPPIIEGLDDGFEKTSKLDDCALPVLHNTDGQISEDKYLNESIVNASEEIKDKLLASDTAQLLHTVVDEVNEGIRKLSKLGDSIFPDLPKTDDQVAEDKFLNEIIVNAPEEIKETSGHELSDGDGKSITLAERIMERVESGTVPVVLKSDGDAQNSSCGVSFSNDEYEQGNKLEVQGMHICEEEKGLLHESSYQSLYFDAERVEHGPLPPPTVNLNLECPMDDMVVETEKKASIGLDIMVSVEREGGVRTSQSVLPLDIMNSGDLDMYKEKKASFAMDDMTYSDEDNIATVDAAMENRMIRSETDRVEFVTDAEGNNIGCCLTEGDLYGIMGGKNNLEEKEVVVEDPVQEDEENKEWVSKVDETSDSMPYSSMDNTVTSTEHSEEILDIQKGAPEQDIGGLADGRVRQGENHLVLGNCEERVENGDQNVEQSILEDMVQVIVSVMMQEYLDDEKERNPYLEVKNSNVYIHEEMFSEIVTDQRAIEAEEFKPQYKMNFGSPGSPDGHRNNNCMAETTCPGGMEVMKENFVDGTKMVEQTLNGGSPLAARSICDVKSSSDLPAAVVSCKDPERKNLDMLVGDNAGTDKLRMLESVPGEKVYDDLNNGLYGPEEENHTPDAKETEEIRDLHNIGSAATCSADLTKPSMLKPVMGIDWFTDSPDSALKHENKAVESEVASPILDSFGMKALFKDDQASGLQKSGQEMSKGNSEGDYVEDMKDFKDSIDHSQVAGELLHQKHKLLQEVVEFKSAQEMCNHCLTGSALMDTDVQISSFGDVSTEVEPCFDNAFAKPQTCKGAAMASEFIVSSSHGDICELKEFSKADRESAKEKVVTDVCLGDQPSENLKVSGDREMLVEPEDDANSLLPVECLKSNMATGIEVSKKNAASSSKDSTSDEQSRCNLFDDVLADGSRDNNDVADKVSTGSMEAVIGIKNGGDGLDSVEKTPQRLDGGSLPEETNSSYGKSFSDISCRKGSDSASSLDNVSFCCGLFTKRHLSVQEDRGLKGRRDSGVNVESVNAVMDCFAEIPVTASRHDQTEVQALDNVASPLVDSLGMDWLFGEDDKFKKGDQEMSTANSTGVEVKNGNGGVAIPPVGAGEHQPLEEVLNLQSFQEFGIHCPPCSPVSEISVHAKPDSVRERALEEDWEKSSSVSTTTRQNKNQDVFIPKTPKNLIIESDMKENFNGRKSEHVRNITSMKPLHNRRALEDLQNK